MALTARQRLEAMVGREHAEAVISEVEQEVGKNIVEALPRIQVKTESADRVKKYIYEMYGVR